MKVFVSSTAPTISSEVDQKFGRCSYFLVYDTETRKTRIIENVSSDISQGAGVSTSQKIVSEGANVVITGNIGPRAFEILSASGVTIFLTEKMSVREAIADYERGVLSPIESATIEGHEILGIKPEDGTESSERGVWKAIDHSESPKAKRKRIKFLERELTRLKDSLHDENE
jgi:predicted Fe-Mo cluster-binding NifX family protein